MCQTPQECLPVRTTYDNNRVVSACGLYTVEAQQVPDGHEEGTIIVADAEYVRMKSYQRPVS